MKGPDRIKIYLFMFSQKNSLVRAKSTNFKSIFLFDVNICLCLSKRWRTTNEAPSYQINSFSEKYKGWPDHLKQFLKVLNIFKILTNSNKMTKGDQNVELQSSEKSICLKDHFQRSELPKANLITSTKIWRIYL